MGRDMISLFVGAGAQGRLVVKRVVTILSPTTTSYVATLVSQKYLLTLNSNVGQ